MGKAILDWSSNEPTNSREDCELYFYLVYCVCVCACVCVCMCVCDLCTISRFDEAGLEFSLHTILSTFSIGTLRCPLLYDITSIHT